MNPNHNVQRLMLALWGLIACANCAGAASPVAPTTANLSTTEGIATDVNHLIKEFSSDRYAMRRRAMRDMMLLPTIAAPQALKALQAATVGNAEVLQRARLLEPALTVRASHARKQYAAQKWIASRLLSDYRAPAGATTNWSAAARTMLQLLPLENTCQWTQGDEEKLKIAAGIIWNYPEGKGLTPPKVPLVACDAAWFEWQHNRKELNREVAWSAYAAHSFFSPRDWKHPYQRAWVDALATIIKCSQLQARHVTKFNWADTSPGRMAEFATDSMGMVAEKARYNSAIPQQVVTNLARLCLRDVHAIHQTVGKRQWDSGISMRLALANDPGNFLGQLRTAQRDFRGMIGPYPDYRPLRMQFARIFRLAPWSAAAANGVLQCDSHISESDKNYDKWFARATNADPTDYEAYAARFEYIKTHSINQSLSLLQFARGAAATGFWKTKIPFLLIVARLYLAGRQIDPAAYYQRPGVWRDLRLACAGYVRNNPKSIFYRNEYAWLACLCGHWTRANREFAILGDHCDTQIFGSQLRFKFYRSRARALARH